MWRQNVDFRFKYRFIFLSRAKVSARFTARRRCAAPAHPARPCTCRSHAELHHVPVMATKQCCARYTSFVGRAPRPPPGASRPRQRKFGTAQLSVRNVSFSSASFLEASALSFRPINFLLKFLQFLLLPAFSLLIISSSLQFFANPTRHCGVRSTPCHIARRRKAKNALQEHGVGATKQQPSPAGSSQRWLQREASPSARTAPNPCLQS